MGVTRNIRGRACRAHSKPDVSEPLVSSASKLSAPGAPAHSAIMYFSMLLPAVSCNSHIDIIVIAHAMAMYIEIPNVL